MKKIAIELVTTITKSAVVEYELTAEQVAWCEAVKTDLYDPYPDLAWIVADMKEENVRWDEEAGVDDQPTNELISGERLEQHPARNKIRAKTVATAIEIAQKAVGEG